jgi:hypothetical protein
LSLYDLNKDMLIQLILKMDSVNELSEEELLSKKVKIEIELNKRRIIEEIKYFDQSCLEYVNKVLKHIDIISQIKNVEDLHYYKEYRFNLYGGGELFYIRKLDENKQDFNFIVENYKEFYLTLNDKYVAFLLAEIIRL